MMRMAMTSGRLWRWVAWSGAAALLLAPAVAMRFTDEVRWTASDFLFAGGLIGGVGLAAEFVLGRSRAWSYRAGALLALLAMFLLMWINAAVGIIGREDNPLNLLYAGVIAVAVGGAIAARFRPEGMRRAMLAAAGCQAAMLLVAVIAERTEPPGVIGLAMLNGGFVALWLAAAWLFGRAARRG